MNPSRHIAALFVLCCAMHAIFWDKPVHLDEANFLRMTTGAFWAPHLVEINWQGHKEAAFDVLSNPPGLVWYLWPFRSWDVHWMRIWMLPWSLVGLWGSFRFGEVLIGKGRALSLVVVSLPFFWISNASLMPDMPLFATAVLGLSGLLRGRHLHIFAFVAGCSALFRYSGITMIPLIGVWAVLNCSKRQVISLTLTAALPTLLLYAHDIYIYGGWHFAHMLDFQSEGSSFDGLLHKFAAFSAMLVGIFVPPVVPIRKWKIVVAALISFGVCSFLSFHPMEDWWNLTFVFLGIWFILHSLVYFASRKEYWMLLWCIGGLFFLLNLRFAATRYWALFFLPFILVFLQENSFRTIKRCSLVYWLIGGALAYDDYGLAKTGEELANRVQMRSEYGYFSGHWGWQYAMENNGWWAVEEDSLLPPDVYFAQSTRSWPQTIETTCFTEESVLVPERKPWILRLHSAEARVNYHANFISNDPPIRSLAPWGLGLDDYDQVLLRRSCSR